MFGYFWEQESEECISLSRNKLTLKLLKKKLFAFLTAFLFLTLPIHGENIYWFSTISVTLGSVFILYAVNAYYNFQKTELKKWYSIAFILSIFAFLSYEIAVV